MAPRKGRLESILLSDLFTSLAESQATGMLTVQNDADTKKIMLDHGQVVIARTGMSEKVLLGDLLISRGLVTEADVEMALEAQKTQDKRLGELLVELKGLTPQAVDEAVKFQVEEEILDLFTWRKGEFEFSDTVSEADKAAISQAGTTFSVDLKVLAEEASKRTEEWRQHEQRITSPYLVFRPTEKALTPAVQKEFEDNALRKRIFKWVQENRTVDTMVCKSCIGRNALYKLLIGWIDERNIELVPVGELKFLASEHRSRHRYYDAMGIYRRLRDAARTEAERRELEGSIADTRQMMEAQQAVQRLQMTANQTASLAHIKRAAVMKRSRMIRSILFYGVGGTVLLAALAFAAVKFGVDHSVEQARLLEDLDTVIRVQMDSGQVATAKAACEKLKAETPELADAIDQRLLSIDANHRATADKKRQAIREQLGMLDLRDLYARLDELKVKFKDIPGFAAKIDKDHRELEQEAAARVAQLKQNSLEKWLLVGAVRQEQGQFERARQAYARAGCMVEEKSATATEIAGRLATMQAIEQSQRQALEAAAALDRSGGDLEAALAQYQTVATMRPRLSWGAAAEARAGQLKAELAAAQKILAAAKSAALGPDATAAETELRLAVIRLAPYGNLADPLKSDLNGLVNKRLQVDAEIQEALRLDQEGRGEQARVKWADLLNRYKAELVRRKLTVPYAVTSNPAGAGVYVGDELLGQTPLNFRLAAEDQRPVEVRLGGFAPHRLDAVERRRLAADVTLAIEPTWRIRLTQGICGGLAFTGNDLFVLNGGQLQCVRPATKSAVFDPQDIIKLPTGDRKREAQSFNGELKPPAWWALQFPPVVAASKEAVWLPVQDCRLVRVGLVDQSVIAVRSPVEAATPLTLYKNPFQKNAEMGLFVGLDGQLYESDLTDTNKSPQVVSKFKYRPVPVRMAGEDVAVAVGEGGELVKLPIGDYDNAKAYTLTQPVIGPVLTAPHTDSLGLPAPRVLVVETDGSLEMLNVADMSRAWTQTAAQFAVRTLTLLDDGGSFLQTGLSGGRAVCELRSVETGPEGQAVWSIALEGNPVRPCASQNMVYVATDDKKIHAYRRSDGVLLWQSPIPGLPERIEANADGTVALVVKEGEERSVLIYKVETGE